MNNYQAFAGFGQASSGGWYKILEQLGAANYWLQDNDSGLIGQIENVDLTLNGNATPITNYESTSGTVYDVEFSGVSDNTSLLLQSDDEYYTFENELSFGWFIKIENPLSNIAHSFWCGDPAGINLFALYGGRRQSSFTNTLATSRGGGNDIPLPQFEVGEYLIIFVKSIAGPPSDTFTVYINGQIAGTITYNINPVTENKQRINFLKANIDNFYACPFLFDRALTQSEITDINNAALL